LALDFFDANSVESPFLAIPHLSEWLAMKAMSWCHLQPIPIGCAGKASLRWTQSDSNDLPELLDSREMGGGQIIPTSSPSGRQA
jgi:hypothetical protein